MEIDGLPPDVLVVGGGLAGLTTACYLVGGGAGASAFKSRCLNAPLRSAVVPQRSIAAALP